MAVELDVDSFFIDDLVSAIVVDGRACDVVAGPVEQRDSDYDGSRTARWKFLGREEDFPSLYMGERLDVDGVEWEVEDLDDSGVGVIQVQLIREIF